jgi:hypothetical protein
MGRFYETTATPTVDYSAKFPFQELFQAHQYQQNRSDQAYKDLGLAWDELLKVGYIPGGADEEYVKSKRGEFENLYKSATEKGNLANNYNWIQRQISLIGRDPSLIDIHRSYLGGNEKIKNDQQLKQKGQFKDHMSPDNFGWDTKSQGIFGTQGDQFTTPWLEWRPTALSYFNDVPDDTKTGQQGWEYLSDISANSAADFAASPEGNMAIDEHVRMGTYTEGLDPNDPNFRNDVAYRILQGQAEEVWKRAQGPTDPNANKNRNKNNGTDTPITTVPNPYYDVLTDIYRPSFDGSENPYTNSENVQMVNGAQLNQKQIDDLLGIQIQNVKDDNGNVIGTKRMINLGKDVYLDVGDMGGGVHYAYDEGTGEYSANTDLSQSSSYERARQAYDIRLLTDFYEQGWVQEIMDGARVEIGEGATGSIKRIEEIMDANPGMSKAAASRRLEFEISKEYIEAHPQFKASRQLLLQNGVDPIMSEYYNLYEAHSNHLNSLDPDDDKVSSLMGQFQHNIQSLEGLDIEFKVNDTDDNTFLTYGFNANGEPEDRLAVRGYAIVPEDALEAVFGQSANVWSANDWVDQLVDRAGVIKEENRDGDNTTYKIPLYIPIEMSESRMETYNTSSGQLGTGAAKNELIGKRKEQFRGMVDFNVRGNYAQMQQRSLTMLGNNNGQTLKVNMNDGNVGVQKQELISNANGFKNTTLKNQALQEIDDVFAALHIHSPTKFNGAISGTLDSDYKSEVLKEYPTMEAAMQAYKVLSVNLGTKGWNHQELGPEEVELNYSNGNQGSIGALDPNTLKATHNGSTYIDATKPGYNVITDVQTYKEVAANELRTDVPTIDITEQTGDDAVITNTNYTVKSTAYSPHLTETSGRYFNALLGDVGINLTVTGAHRTKAYNDALSLKHGHKSPGYHVNCQALDLAPNKGLINFLNKFDKQTLLTEYGIVNYAVEGKGTANHHVHLEFAK